MPTAPDSAVAQLPAPEERFALWHHALLKLREDWRSVPARVLVDLRRFLEVDEPKFDPEDPNPYAAAVRDGKYQAWLHVLSRREWSDEQVVALASHLAEGEELPHGWRESESRSRESLDRDLAGRGPEG